MFNGLKMEGRKNPENEWVGKMNNDVRFSLRRNEKTMVKKSFSFFFPPFEKQEKLFSSAFLLVNWQNVCVFVENYKFDDVINKYG
jgi:hypothetical protein